MRQQQENRIALFTGSLRTPTGFLISVATNCAFVHAAIRVDGVWYHASETIGRFDRMNVDLFRQRDCAVYKFGGDLGGWLRGMEGTQYDWRGVLGWVGHVLGLRAGTRGNPRKFYCFEAALNALAHVGRDVPESPVSGCDVAKLFPVGRYGTFGRLLEV